jgi:UDP-N-acetylmuramyl pentapeptide phosphotransferase/UDP-N-acetylglucosamine-1-phosphate transferase
MVTLVAAAVTAFFISFLLIPIIIQFSKEKNLVDMPGRRKIHKKVTPSLGGIGIFLGFLVATLLWVNTQYWSNLRYLLIAQSILFFVGLRDDLLPLSPITKLVGQVVASAILVVFMDLRLQSFHGIFGIYDLHPLISYIFTFFTMLVIINSFNLIDGLDGLAGLLGIISSFVLGIWFFLAGEHMFAILALAMTGALLAFLWYNWEPSRIFMGDTGSMILGLTLSVLIIRFIDLHRVIPVESTIRFAAAPTAAIAIILVPLTDTLRVFIIRILRGQSPFSADKNHIHHHLMRLGFSHSQTALMLGFLQLGFIGLTVGLRNYSNAVVLPLLIVLAFSFTLLLDRLLRKKLM